MSIRAELIGENPTIEVEVNRFHNGKVNYETVKLGALEIEVDEKIAIELLEKIDFALFDETKEDLEAKVEKLEEQIYRLEEHIDEVATTHEESDNIWLDSDR